MMSDGVVSSGHEANVENARALIGGDAGSASAKMEMLFDPQTSGGLLIAVPAERAAALCEKLREQGCAAATEIGEIATTENAADGKCLFLAN